MLKVRTLFCLYNEGIFLAQTPVETNFGRTTDDRPKTSCVSEGGRGTALLGKIPTY